MPGKRKRRARPKHDASYKRFFARRRTVADTLRGFARDLARRLDFSTLQRLPASFVTEHLGQRHADMLWRIKTTDGDWLYLLILLEFQSTIDRRMALRMMDYTARVWTGLGEADLGPGGEYPFVLPIVVYNGEQHWNAAMDVRDLLAPVPKELFGYLPRHRYVLIEIQAIDPSRLPPDNVLAMIARFEQASSPQAVEALISPLADWLEGVGEPEFVETFTVWITLVVAQRFGPAGSELEHKLRKEEEGKMTTLIERSRKWGKEYRREWLEKGIERGREEGERVLACQLATDRFGPDVAQELSQLLDELPGSVRVSSVVRRIFESETGEEFLEWVKKA